MDAVVSGFVEYEEFIENLRQAAEHMPKPAEYGSSSRSDKRDVKMVATNEAGVSPYEWERSLAESVHVAVEVARRHKVGL